jgi:hypothetical protein
MWNHRIPAYAVLVLVVCALALGLWAGTALWYPQTGRVVSVCEVDA